MSSGFGGHELVTATAVFSLLVLLGFAVSKVLGLTGTAALAPSAALLGGFVLLVVGANVIEAVRRRRRS